MKKILYTLLAGALTLASCSKEAAEELAPQTENTTFTLAVEQAETRATSVIAPARYVMEVWSEDGTQPENVFENGTKNHAEITSGNSFTLTLDKTKAYTCLFWADDNTAFNAASLKAIGLNSGKDMTEAYHAKVAVPKGKNPAVAVTLKRAVAKITFTETAAVKTTDDLALKLTNIYPQFSVLDGAATGTTAEWTKTVKPTATTGVIATFYFFAKTDKELSDLTFTYAAEASKTVSNIPVQQNHATSIKGEYSNVSSFTFNVTADDEWNTPDNEVQLPVNVGDFYYKDGTWSSTYIDNSLNPCIGIVFVVNADGKSGKIVSLDEPAENWNGANPVGKLTWGPNPSTTTATDNFNGVANMATIRALDNMFARYPAFAWVESKNTPAISGINWYLPAQKELHQLYAAMSGLRWVEMGAGAGEIEDWPDAKVMPNKADYAYARTYFNNLFTIAKGTPMDIESNDASFYLSSTDQTKTDAFGSYFNSGYNGISKKDVNFGVRAISVF